MEKHFSELEKALNDCILNCRQNGYVVTRTGIHLQAMKAKAEKLAVENSFHVSAGWCTRFVTCHGLLHERTKITQKLPKDLEDKILAFQKYGKKFILKCSK